MKKLGKYLMIIAAGSMALLLLFLLFVVIVNGITDKKTIYDAITLRWAITTLALLVIGLFLVGIDNRKEIVIEVKKFINS